MATPSLLQIDDRDPLIFYSPNTSWIRGGAAGDFDGTSTLTSSTGASATLTFTGTGISVWGTIQLLTPNTSTYVVSSYSIDDGPTTTFNATEKAGYQFQQKLFQSDTLTGSTPHTIVATLVNNATFFIDYFLVIPTANSTSTSGLSSNSPSSSLVGPVTVSGADSTITASAGPQSHSTRNSLGPIVGGTLGGLVLVIFAILAFLFCCKRRKDKNQMNDSRAQVSPSPFVTPASRSIPMQQHQPYEGSDRVSDQQSSPTNTSSSGVIPSFSKAAAQLSNPSPRRDSLHSRPLSDSPEPPGYNE